MLLLDRINILSTVGLTQFDGKKEENFCIIRWTKICLVGGQLKKGKGKATHEINVHSNKLRQPMPPRMGRHELAQAFFRHLGKNLKCQFF